MVKTVIIKSGIFVFMNKFLVNKTVKQSSMEVVNIEPVKEICATFNWNKKHARYVVQCIIPNKDYT